MEFAVHTYGNAAAASQHHILGFACFYVDPQSRALMNMWGIPF